MKHHNQSFFGQKTAIILDSADWSHPYLYLRFLKKKLDGTWEKPSLKEGKVIKLNLLELISIIKPLSEGEGKWSTVHKFKDENTQIFWECKPEFATLGIPGYQKYLKFPETVLFLNLLKHIYDEKIIYATGNSVEVSQNRKPPQNIFQADEDEFEKPIELEEPHQRNNIDNNRTNITSPTGNLAEKTNKDSKIKSINISSVDPNLWLSGLQLNDEFCLVPGEIMAKRDKAWAFQVLNFRQIWVPKSLIKDKGETAADNGIWIKQWFLEKKLEDIFAPQTA
jgi:hypothetical protein